MSIAMHRRTSQTLWFSATVAAGLLYPGTGWTGEGFDRYEVILHRRPFGDVPIEEPPPENPVPTEASFVKNLRICSMTQPEGSGIKVGIVDAAAKKNYILAVGETDGGITLVSADMMEEQAVLQVGTEVAMVKLAANANAPRLGARTTTRAGGTTTTAANYAERRQERREALARPERQAREMPQPKYSGEELRQHLQEYNMEAIRQGLPALPIELTPDQDAQLVAEGLLEPPPGAPALAPPPAAAVPGPAPTPEPVAEPQQDWTSESIGDIPIDQLTTEELNLLESLMR